MTPDLVVVLDEWLRPPDTALRLRARRLTIWHAAKALTELAARENRDFTDEEQGRWDLMMAELTRLNTCIRAYDRRGYLGAAPAARWSSRGARPTDRAGTG